MYPNLAQCEDSVTSIEFVTKHENGLLFYNGPVQKLDNDDPRDFIALELNGGYPKLIIDHGTGILSLHLDGKDANGNTKMQKLNDGSWHHIDVIREGKVGLLINVMLQAKTTLCLICGVLRKWCQYFLYVFSINENISCYNHCVTFILEFSIAADNYLNRI